MSVDAILEQVKALTPEERAELRDRLDEDFPDIESTLPPELEAELNRRLALFDANPNQGYTVDEVIEYMKRKR